MINTVWFHLHKVFKVVELTEAESTMVVVRGWMEKETENCCLVSTELQSGKMKKF